MNEKEEMQAMLLAHQWALEIVFTKLREQKVTGISETARELVVPHLPKDDSGLTDRALEILDDIIDPAV